MTRRIALTILGFGCFLSLVLISYRPVLFEDGQFAYRDAAYFYYPLYQRVQQEWNSGRWPLWDPAQNAGTPLLGNPMAAVLYPGKVLYALFAYAWGARLYVIAHTIIAFLGMVALGRSCGVSRVGSFLGALSYAFGAPVLFLYSNVIFLVGAAWVPWALRAIDRLLRQRRRLGGVELAVFLALQVLGGDPQAAYLSALCGMGYAVVLAWHAHGHEIRLITWSRVLGVLGVWIAATVGLAYARFDPARHSATRVVVLGAWVALGLVMAWRWRRRPEEARIAPMLAELGGALALAIALSAVQLGPVLEFASLSSRLTSDDWTRQMYHLSLEPYRLVEMVWPNVFGTPSPENRTWIEAIPPSGDREIWVVSLYMGGLALVLSLSAVGMRGVPAWRAWMMGIAVVGLLASFGKFASLIWWARWTPLAAVLGAHDPRFGDVRLDNLLDDGAFSPYGILAILLPGFGSFRYPSKLFTFFAAALAVLVGAGWDRLVAGESKTARRLGSIGLGASLAGLAVSLAIRGRVVASLTGRITADASYGPVDVSGSWFETQRALAQGAIVYAAILALAHWAPRRPRFAGAIAMLLLSADLALGNAGLIWTAPQLDFETPPEALRLIADAERADPSPGPFRIHRMAVWQPALFSNQSSAERCHELIAWDRGTLRALYGLPLGIEYCAVLGFVDLEDYAPFFGAQYIPVPADMARALGVPRDHPVCYFARRSYDLWGARYFILPARSDGWDRKDRGYASFLADTDLIHPSLELVGSAGDPSRRESWATNHDWRLHRNRAAFPRAWVAHYARVLPPVSNPAERLDLLRDILFMNDPIWNDPDRPIYDLRAMAFLETNDKASLKGYISRRPVEPSESVVVIQNEPQRVELKAVLNRPGLVVLADAFYPGWRLTIDGTPAPIYRANRMMRAAAVRAGEHTLVYTYDPISFRIGLIVSIVGLIALMTFLWRAKGWTVTPDGKPVASTSEPG